MKELEWNKRKSFKWHDIWVKAGRLIAGVFTNIMRTTRKQYNFTVKRLCQSQTEQRNSKLANAFIDSRALNEFWAEVKRRNARSSNSSCFYNYVNGRSRPADLANDFMKIYRDVFCACFTSCHDLQSFQNKINNFCIDKKWLPFDVG